MERFITANGCALRVADYPARNKSDGEITIVLLHGYLETMDVWEEVVCHLANKYRVVMMDFPGHGISQTVAETHSMEFLADMIADVIHKLEIGKVLLVGHSLGGYAALEFLRKYPDKLSKLILLHATPNAYTAEIIEQRRREIEVIEAGKKEVVMRDAFSARFAEQNRDRLKDIIEAIEEETTLMDDEGIVALLRGMCERRDNNELVAETEIPVMFIFGRHDELISTEVVSKLIERHSPKAKIEWLEESGHMGLIEESERCAQLITEFAALE